MYEHILLAVALQHGDMPSSHALAARDAAVALAQGVGAQLSVLTVYRYPDFMPSELLIEEQGRYRQSQIQQADAQMQARLTELFADLCWRDVPLTVLLHTGRPGPLIVAAADELGVDLIVIGTHRKRHVLDILLGGTAGYVSRHALCPVLLVQPSKLQWFLGD
ncbi:MAG TPA: universal stress protein [Candidatus Tectomicrobia bacterium]|nr:universal stress protein [Candidatus Tectomicrobia bacterium]